MSDFERIRYEQPAAAVGRIVLAREDRRNAQDKQMIYEIDRAFGLAMQDDSIKVVILAADGPHFSSGHDLADITPLRDFEPVTQAGGYDLPGAHGQMAAEEEVFLGMCWRWRNLPKPTIAQVQGKAIAGGLMLVWPCDLIVASEDAEFSDPVVAFGVNGHEFFVHAWEFGARKAKEILFTGVALTADECHRLGMVNHVVPREELSSLYARTRRAHRPPTKFRTQDCKVLGQSEPRCPGPMECSSDGVLTSSSRARAGTLAPRWVIRRSGRNRLDSQRCTRVSQKVGIEGVLLKRMFLAMLATETNICSPIPTGPDLWRDTLLAHRLG